MDDISLSWSGPIQNSSWHFDRGLHLQPHFPHLWFNLPATYMEAVETPANSGDFVWHRRTLTYTYTPLSGNMVELDAKYEGIAVGSRLLISQPRTLSLARTLWSRSSPVSQGQATFPANNPTTPGAGYRHPVDALPPPIPIINDRRTTVIYEITSPQIRFWGYRYPGKTQRLYGLYCCRSAPETVEIGHTIENNAFVPGVQFTTAGCRGRAQRHPA